MHIRKNLTRLGIVISFICAVSSCKTSQDSSTDLITIDVEKAYDSPHQEALLSEFVSDIEYVKLETNDSCLLDESAFPEHISNNYIVLMQYTPRRVLLFSRSGNYLNDIGVNGNGPGEFTSIHDPTISNDEQFVVFKDMTKGLFVYNIDGTFRGLLRNEDYQIDRHGITPDNLIAVFRYRSNLPLNGGSQILLFDRDLNLIDSVAFNNQDTDPPIRISYDQMISNNNNLYLQNRLSDTIWNVSNNDVYRPELVLNLGKYKVPNFNISEEKVYDYFDVINFTTTPGYYLIIFFNDPKNKQPPRIGRAYYVFNKKKKQGYFLKTHEVFKIDGVGNTRMPENDLDGLPNPTLFNTKYIAGDRSEMCSFEKLNIVDLQEYEKLGILQSDNLKTEKYYNRLKKLLDESDLEDNPIIRICYLK